MGLQIQTGSTHTQKIKPITGVSALQISAGTATSSISVLDILNEISGPTTIFSFFPNGVFQALGSLPRLATGTVLGTPSNGDGAPDGSMVVDNTNNLFYFKSGGIYSQVLGSSSSPTFSKIQISPTTGLALKIDPYGVAAGNTGEIRLLELVINGTNYIGFKSPDNVASSVIWTLPNSDGAGGQILSTNGGGVLSWASVQTNPMTLLGDTIYGGTGGSQTVLSGNTTTAKLFLTQTGTGLVSAAPLWATISSGDLPTVPISKGGTGQTTASGAFNALSPITTLGDIDYGSGANTVTRLAGNVTTTRNFLRQTGTGSVSTAPLWDTLLAADVPKTLDHTWVTDFDTQVRTSRLDQMAVPTASVSMNSQLITNVLNPVSQQDATTKAYSDTKPVKVSAKVATTGVLSAYTYLSNVITANSNGALPNQDGQPISVNDILLVKNETGGNQPYNGVYTTTQVGDGSHPFILTRTADATTASQIQGSFINIIQGTTQASTIWACTAFNPTIGVSNLSYVKVAGNGIVINPMTTLGDVVYGGTAGAPTRLAGVLPTTRSFLLSVGSGGIATAPSWTTLLAADVPKTLDHTWVTDFDTQVRTSRLDQMAVPTASVNFNSQNITFLATPLVGTDAATKAYVDAVAQGLSVKPSAKAATVAVLPSYTYNNGASGVGATITVTVTGTLTVDSYLTALNDYVLVKNETAGNAPYNGLYKVTTAGAVGVQAVLTRAVEMDSSSKYVGAFVLIETGTVNSGAGFVCINASLPTVGTTNITFTQFSGAGEITVLSPIVLTGNQISFSASYIGQSSITTLGTITTGIWNGTALTAAYLPVLNSITAPTGNVSLNSNKITNLADATSDLDAINQEIFFSKTHHDSVRYIQTTALPANTYNNGASGVGATLTANANAALTVDSNAVAVNNTVVVNGEVTTANNGIYTVTQTGDGSTPYILTRRTDADTSLKWSKNVMVFVHAGTIHGGSWWFSSSTPATIGTNSISFTAYIGQIDITTLGTVTLGTWNATAVTVPFGGTGLTSTTAYGVIAGGTTSTGNLQNVGTGTTGYYLVSNGSGALPTWQQPLVGICSGRLTVISGSPVPTSDTATATTVYFDSYNGNHISLYDGTNWGQYTIPSDEISVALGTLANATNYDLYVWNNAGTVTLSLSTGWTGSSRGAGAAPQLITQNGVLVNKFTDGSIPAKNGRYVGTITTISTTQTTDTVTQRYVYNYYNRVPRSLASNDSSTRSTTSSTFSQVGTVQVSYTNGIQDQAVSLYGRSNTFGSSASFSELAIGSATNTIATGCAVQTTGGANTSSQTSSVTACVELAPLGIVTRYLIFASSNNTLSVSMFGGNANAPNTTLSGLINQ